MLPNLSQRAHSFRASAIRKLDAAVARRTDTRFHRLNIGQPDVPTPVALRDAIAAFAKDEKVVRYGPASGLAACRAAAAAYHSRWRSSLSADHIAVTHGGSEALLFAFAAACDAGDEVLVPEPFYTNYNGFAKLADVSLRPIPTSLEAGFAIPDDDALDALVTPKTRAFVFSNPANPTGKIYERSEVERLVRWTERRNLWLISDEVYRRIWFSNPPASVLEFEGDHLMCVDSLSKTYSACGARLGFLICGSEDLMARIERFGQARLGPQPLAQHMAIAAYGLPEAYYEETRLRYKARIEALLAGLAKIDGVKTHAPDGAFYLMCALPLEDSEDFARFLAEDFSHEGESVVVAPAPGFYAGTEQGRDQIRLAAVTEEASLTRACELLAAALNAYQAA
ncbi:MAG: pyridoxal phosphate-dependent aminotransferase [Myxococcota bacterium]